MEAKEVLEKIRKLQSMKELEPPEFCEENGYADILAKSFGKNLKPTQLRKFFHALKDVQRNLKKQSFDRKGIVKLLPELAYALGRELIPKQFYELMKVCLSAQRLKDDQDFERVMQFLTALLAYHKFHEKVKDGGRE